MSRATLGGDAGGAGGAAELPPDSAQAGWWTAWLSLAASGGTLVCCALPALLVSLGLGAALAGLVCAWACRPGSARAREIRPRATVLCMRLLTSNPSLC
jgi:hypothetical protein